MSYISEKILKKFNQTQYDAVCLIADNFKRQLRYMSVRYFFEFGLRPADQKVVDFLVETEAVDINQGEIFVNSQWLRNILAATSCKYKKDVLSKLKFDVGGVCHVCHCHRKNTMYVMIKDEITCSNFHICQKCIGSMNKYMNVVRD